MAESVQFLSQIAILPAFHDAEGRAVDIRYAPEGAAVANVYYTNGYASPLSLGQLVAAVMLRAAAANEARAVFKLNVLNEATSKQKLSSYVDKLICDELVRQVGDGWRATGEPAPPSLDLRTDQRTENLTAQAREFLYHPKTEEFTADPSVYVYLTRECGLSGVPTKLEKYDDFIALHETMRPAMEETTRSSAITQAELESAVSRRDVAYTTSANLVKAITGTLTGAAEALRI